MHSIKLLSKAFECVLLLYLSVERLFVNTNRAALGIEDAMTALSFCLPPPLYISSDFFFCVIMWLNIWLWQISVDFHPKCSHGRLYDSRQTGQVSPEQNDRPLLSGSRDSRAK